MNDNESIIKLIKNLSIHLGQVNGNVISKEKSKNIIWDSLLENVLIKNDFK